MLDNVRLALGQLKLLVITNYDELGEKRHMTWREHCAPLIHEVLERTKGKPEKEIKAALHAAYPFGERKYHPYKIWLSEIKVQYEAVS